MNLGLCSLLRTSVDEAFTFGALEHESCSDGFFSSCVEVQFQQMMVRLQADMYVVFVHTAHAMLLWSKVWRRAGDEKRTVLLLL